MGDLFDHPWRYLPRLATWLLTCFVGVLLAALALPFSDDLKRCERPPDEVPAAARLVAEGGLRGEALPLAVPAGGTVELLAADEIVYVGFHDIEPPDARPVEVEWPDGAYTRRLFVTAIRPGERLRLYVQIGRGDSVSLAIETTSADSTAPGPVFLKRLDRCPPAYRRSDALRLLGPFLRILF